MPLLAALYNFAVWLVQDRSDAEDLVQETYLKALRHFDSFQPGTNFKAWIFRILKNTHCSSYTRQKRRVMIGADFEEDAFLLPETSNDPERLLIERAEIADLQRAIEELPPIFREVLLLREVEDISYREIAEILSIPPGTVMSRLARARKMIRESLRGSYTAAGVQNFLGRSDTSTVGVEIQ